MGRMICNEVDKSSIKWSKISAYYRMSDAVVTGVVLFDGHLFKAES
jgi:hypothetical protein